MPLNLVLNNSSESLKPETLYIVATPIGNIEDISIRSLKVLDQVDLIAAEDTRETQKLLKHYNISTSLIACHDHNETQCAEKLITQLKKGATIALVSDAGTPTVSDPGYRVVLKAINENIKIVPIPGASAAITALSVSGLPSDSFVFQGFLPKKQGKKLKILSQLSLEPRTIIFYESPKRIISLLEELIKILGDREAMLGRELTKLYEECIRGKLSHIRECICNKKTIKGECTLLVSGYDPKSKTYDNKELRQKIKKYLEENDDLPMSQCVKNIVTLYGASRKKVYDISLDIKNEK